MKNYNLWARAFFALLLMVTLVVLGLLIFRAGIAYGSGATVEIRPMAASPFGLLLLAVFGFILFLFAAKLILGAIFFPMMGRRSWRVVAHPHSMRMWSYGKWGEDQQDLIREWHRRLHEEQNQEQSQGEATA